MIDKNDSSDASMNPQTLVELLRTRARHLPDKQAFLFLFDGEEEDASVTFGELDQRARSIAAWLQQEEAADGRALLLYPPGLDFIAAFFGCLYAGVVAVPVYPPRLNRPSPRIQSIVADAQITVALTTTKIYQGLERRFDLMPELSTLRWLNSEEMPGDLSGQWQDPGIRSEHLAFLQYTSGSTGSPKGVMLSHGNLIHNLTVIYHGFEMENGSTGAFWLPSYHDMGLIGGILSPIYVKGHAVLMAPGAFLQRPLRWLEAISRYKAKISGAPNFAYQLCVDKITPEQREGLDLSSWDIAFCGAEPIRLDTLDSFAQAFAAQGFRREAFYPCYGLAENTLMVSGGAGPSEPLAIEFNTAALSQGRGIPAKGTEAGITLISCGHALLDQQIAIVDPEKRTVCAPGEIGEIWTTGPSVAQGYWQRPQLTEETFQARLAGREQETFLRTGDLGFLLEGELYFTGRLKDLIIIRGRNHYPQDIEHTAGQCHEALEAGMSAAFAVYEGGEERLVLVHEVTRRHRKPDLEAVVTAVRRAVAQEHGLQVQAIVLIRPLSVPRTSSGKIQRHACKEGYLDGTLQVVGEWRAGEATAGSGQPAAAANGAAYGAQMATDIAQWIVELIANQLNIPAQKIDTRAPFVDFGLDSVQAVSISGEIETQLGRSLSPTLLWDYPTVTALAAHLAEAGAGATVPETAHPLPEASQQGGSRPPEPIAVIGLSCRFPGADGPEAFWQLLHEGGDAVQEVPPERWDLERFYSAGSDPGPGKMSTRWGGFLAEVDKFDAAFFAIAPREAARLDPQQRLLLEVTWEALERAGQKPGDLAGSATGVFVGISSSDYSRLQFSDPALIDAYAGTGNAHSVAANRLSYFLDLQGPSMAIDTACSSSLVAAHLGMNSLRSGEVNLALVGGVNVLLAPDLTIAFSQAQMMAADGRCKTFDARADGYVRGEGCGMLVLKRLSDAERDGDPVLAVLRGSAVNQDGRSNGLTAPNGLAQQAVIRQALANAGVTAAEIDYIEAHGTGTRLGDPIEIRSLQAVLDEDAVQKPVMVGSVKTNIGHLEAAAGVAGLIKTILALAQERIPPHLHFETLNPHITLDDSRLVIGGMGHDWQRGEEARLAGVSSFGFGGTNAHVIVEEGSKEWRVESGEWRAARDEWPAQLLTLSARDEEALGQLAERYAAALAANPALELADVCYTANTGRAAFEQRLAVVARSKEELQRALAAFKPQRGGRPAPFKVAFLFTGQGAQYAGMGRELYDSQPVFRAALARCAAILDENGGDRETSQVQQLSLLDVIYPGEEHAAAVDETTYTQPALFALEYALAELWRSWGVEPDVVMGHSVGEFVAACVAGVMSLEDGLRLVAARGRLMGALPAGGAMAAIFAPEAEVKAAAAAYAGRVSIAGYNGPKNIAISGEETAVTAIVDQLAEVGIEYRYLTVSHAFHSPLMDPMLDDFAAIAGEVTFHAPRIPLVSNLTGELMQEAPGADYWRRHAREAVRFTQGMAALANTRATIFLEIGPQPHLTGMGRRCLAADADAAGEAIWLFSLKKGRSDWQLMLDSLGHLITAGLDVDWESFYNETPGRARRVLLPTYPFQRERHWLEEGAASEERRELPGELGRVRRLVTPVPLFEALLDLADGARIEAILHEALLAVAELFWGAGGHMVKSLAISTGQAGGGEPVRTQTSLQVTGEGTAVFQLFAYEEDHDRWHLLAGGQLERGAGSARAASGTVTAPTAITREALLEAAEERRAVLAGDYLQAQAAAVLGLKTQQLSLERPLDSLGMDSLMALELKNRIEQDLGVDLPVVTLLQGPTIRELAAQLLDYLAEIPAQAGTAAARIEPIAAVGEAGPLTHDQQAMWMLHQLLPANVSFNVAGAARVVGELDAGALRRALQELIARHAALRTTFAVENGRPVQIVHETAPGTLLELDATSWDEAAVHSFLEQEAHRPFNLEQGPLLRLVLLQRPAEEALLLLSINHLITDFWSMSLLVQELYLLYTAESTGQERSLPPIELLPADYAYWQAEMLAGAQGEALRQYWLEKLAGELPRLDLPADRQRPAALSFDGDNVSRIFPEGVTADLKRLSQEQGATLATTLLAAFQTLLHRYTGQEDLLVGSVIAGRERPELQNMVGYFVNPVALRADFSGSPTFVQFLAQARQTMFEAITHQEYPLPRLVEELSMINKQPLDPSRPPLFETMFIMQRAQVMADQGLSAFALGIPGTQIDPGQRRCARRIGHGGHPDRI